MVRFKKDNVVSKKVSKQSLKKLSVKPESLRTLDIPVKKTVSKVKIEKLIKRHFSAKEKKEFEDLLLSMRERLSGQIASLKGESLTREDSVVSEEDGTDTFDRQFALSVVSSENDVVLEIDEALHQIDDGTFGVCEKCGQSIEIARLKALPFAKMCIRCKSESESVKQRANRTTVVVPEEENLEL